MEWQFVLLIIFAEGWRFVKAILATEVVGSGKRFKFADYFCL
jgi:hypothetical protein